MNRRACVGALVFLAASSACSPTTPSTGASLNALDGRWSGTTSQGVPIAFSVSPDQKVTSIAVGYNFNGCSGMQTYSDLNLDTRPMVTCIPGPCSNDIASFRSFNYSTGPLNGPATTVNGLFVLASRAEGQASFRDYPGCGTATGVGWTAVRQ